MMTGRTCHMAAVMGVRALFALVTLSILAGCGQRKTLDVDSRAVFAVDGSASADPPGDGPEGAVEATADIPGAAADAEPPAPMEDPPPEYEKAVVYYFTVSVMAKPSTKSTRLGYIRRGTLLEVDGPIEGPGCSEGFYRLVGSMGYVCKSEGLKFDSIDAYIEQAAPHCPWFESVLPYDYGHIMKNDLPAFNRIPTAEEQKQVAVWLAERRAAMEAQREAIEQALEEGSVLPNPYEVKAEVKNPDGTVEEIEVQDAYTVDVEESPVPTEIPFNHVDRILLRGFYVSLNKRVYREGSSWYKTLRGLYVKARNVHVVTSPSTRGAELSEDFSLPVGIVIRKKVSAYMSEDGGTTIKSAKPLSHQRFDVLPIIEEVSTKGQAYYHVGGGSYVRTKDVRRVDVTEPPKTVKEPSQKWIDIDIGKQILVAYEGVTPVYVALISSGREKENLEFKTPRGIHAIVSKHVTGTMDNLYATDGPYAIEDVPWTMYFLGSYALHGAFWHNGFGRMRSHGCVNLAPWDARWLFYWADPVLPPGWHSIYANEDLPGTLVRIHD